MSQLGFTFYPKDWWTSDSFFLLQPFERYIYLECLFIMYSQDGWMSSNKLIVERRLGTTIKDEVWNKIKDLFISDGDLLTHKSVNSRMRKTLSNRENGKLGGRPKKEEVTEEEKPKKPNLETQKNPPSEIEEEREEKEKKNENISFEPKGSETKNFKSLSEEEFKYSLIEFVDEFTKQTVRAFFEYWSEKDSKGKMRFQLQKTWDSKKRLTTWKNNESKFGNSTPVKSTPKPIPGPWN